MRRVTLLVAALAFVAGGCANPLGTSMPQCDLATSTMVLAIQAVPGSRYVSCVESLPVGWGFEALTARSGSSQYSLDSDRMGFNFLVVENLLSCDVGDAVLVDQSRDGVALWKDVEARTTVDVVVVPEGPTAETTQVARDVIRELHAEEIRDRRVVATPSLGDGTTRERIDDAIADGAHVVVVGIRNVEDGTLGLRLVGSTEEETVDGVQAVIEAIDDVETEPSYTGQWYYVFDTGCVRYTFNAHGPGSARLDADVTTALDLYDAEELRDIARGLGYDIR